MDWRRIGTMAGVAAAGALAGCATTPATGPQATRPHVPAVNPAGLERVLGRDADTVIALLGPPDQDQREDRARRLQFVGPACVLDAYLYPKGSGVAVVTWIDARSPEGADFDRASCVAALTRRVVR